jgi:hypothetical protein
MICNGVLTPGHLAHPSDTAAFTLAEVCVGSRKYPLRLRTYTPPKTQVCHPGALVSTAV